MRSLRAAIRQPVATLALLHPTTHRQGFSHALIGACKGHFKYLKYVSEYNFTAFIPGEPADQVTREFNRI